MQTQRFADWTLSRMMLGTVQFGMPYGIANRRGQPSYQDVIEMLTVAAECGVNCCDTAAAYGESERVLGRALRELDLREHMLVVTKVRPLPPEAARDTAIARRCIAQSLEDSLRNLGLDVLPVVLFHREADSRHLDLLAEQRDLGRLRHFGVSCDNPPDGAQALAAEGRVQALQVPGNLLDRRHERSGAFETCAARGIAVFLRSVYLQGLLLMPEEEIPAALQAVVPVRRRLAQIARTGGLAPAELALRYMLSLAPITCVLTGVETVAQVRENAALFEHGPLDAETLAAVRAAVPDLPAEVLTPSHWPRAKTFR